MWVELCKECFKYYEETQHRQKDLCYNCRFDIPITRKENTDRIWISKEHNIHTKSNETN